MCFLSFLITSLQSVNTELNVTFDACETRLFTEPVAPPRGQFLPVGLCDAFSCLRMSGSLTLSNRAKPPLSGPFSAVFCAGSYTWTMVFSVACLHVPLLTRLSPSEAGAGPAPSW